MALVFDTNQIWAEDQDFWASAVAEFTLPWEQQTLAVVYVDLVRAKIEADLIVGLAAAGALVTAASAEVDARLERATQRFQRSAGSAVDEFTKLRKLLTKSGVGLR